jgi:eukaryotic-like serine/threonine-protein kinase
VESIDLLASASPYERSYLETIYLRGLAYLRLRKRAEAVAEFQKIADHKGASWGATWVHPYWGQYYSLSYLGMARGYAYAGETAKAERRIRTSSSCGRAPTLTFAFFAKRKQNTPA